MARCRRQLGGNSFVVVFLLSSILQVLVGVIFFSTTSSPTTIIVQARPLIFITKFQLPTRPISTALSSLQSSLSISLAMSTNDSNNNSSGNGGGSSGGGVSKEQSSVNEEWNAMAGDWDDLASGYRDAFLAKIWGQTGLQVNPVTDSDTTRRVIVDFGCGTGLLTEGIMAAELKSASVGESGSGSPQTSDFVCIDAAPSMIRAVEDKIKAGEWTNVRAYCAALSTYETGSNNSVKADFEQLKGTVDLIVASSVMSFIPSDELPGTLKVLASFLKPGGLFVHSDWPKADDNPTGFTDEKAETMYSYGQLQKKSSLLTTLDMGGGQKGDVYIGVAVKPPL